MSKRFAFFAAAFLSLFFCGSLQADPKQDSQREFFETKIRPVLAAKCYSCHSQQAVANKKLKGQLLLDTREGTRRGGESGPAVVPGKPGESLLLEALKYESFEMPPTGKLPSQVIADFERWINQGAFDPRDGKAADVTHKIDFARASKFWAFQKPTASNPPQVKNHSWPQNDIDRFVLARLEKAGLAPSPAADRRTLIRRAHFDLIGLPPTPEQIEQFVNDQSPNAYENLIDRLLRSEHYGERWGRHWLDVARYGEDQAHTFKARKYPRGYLYRDWIVKAFNDDMPYDRFLTYQLAGDLVDAPDKHQRLAALGFFALGPVYYQDNGEKAKALADEWDDRLDTLMRGVLGLTATCGRCHDHKYDPITMADYYALAGIFASTNYQERPVVSDHIVQQRRAADEKTRKQQLDIDRFLADQARGLRVALVDDIPAYMTAAFKAINRRKVDAKNKKLIETIAKQEKVSPQLLTRWVAYLTNGATKKDPWLAEWHKLLAAGDKKQDFSKDQASLKKVRALADALAADVRDKATNKEALFKKYGENAAFLASGDRAEVLHGQIPLGNLFDDGKGVSLDAALASDRFKATAAANRLGVLQVKNGWGEVTQIAPGVQFHFGKLGSDKSAYGSICNDAWNTGGGIRTQGQQIPNNAKRTEQGIGMHANALVTFDLDEIRRAGLLPADQKFAFRVDRAGLNDDVFGSGSSSVHLAVLVTKPHDKQEVYDAVLAGYVNGQKMTIDENDKVYYFGGEIPKPLKADGRFVAFEIAIPPQAKHLTLVATGAGDPDDNPINSDHAVFSGARLELDPPPKATNTKPDAVAKATDGTKLNRLDAVLLSRMFYDEGLLALPAKEAEGLLPAATKQQLQHMRKRQQQLKKDAEAIAITLAHSLAEGKPADLKIYLRGDPTNQGEVAPRAMPAIFTGGISKPFAAKGSGRLELARAIASVDNPLTARVIVNRVWAAHFGEGLVRTTSNFGKLGERPTHPLLLDYLAVRFMQEGWSLKKLHRQIMLSAAYRQASRYDEANYQTDPENRLLWRMNRRRLEIEPWRDALLAVSGELDATLGGPSQSLTSAGNKRRTLYGFISRHRLDELLRLFDFPDPNITSAQRTVTTVPLQQLFVLNSDFMMQRAKALVARLERESVGDDKEKVRRAYLLLFGRQPDEQELEQGVEFVGQQTDKADKLTPWQQYALALLSANEFLFVD